ncbi:hypothetical protein D5081_17300 [Pectobacterium carotovorum]|nr:hypothetical protein D5081_17300 [Pectobacterium carotovorum]RJL38265.1 hypothetical protein D5083_17300 [Pectobacterium carotovorum]
MRWLPFLTPVTYLSKLLGIRAVAAFMQLELFRVYKIRRKWITARCRRQRPRGYGLLAWLDTGLHLPA